MTTSEGPSDGVRDFGDGSTTTDAAYQADDTGCLDSDCDELNLEPRLRLIVLIEAPQETVQNPNLFYSTRFPDISMISRIVKTLVLAVSTRVSHPQLHFGNPKFLGTVRFVNDHVAAILGYDDLQWGNILITRVYFVEGLGHNLFLVGQFCDSDLEVAYRRNTCFVRNLEGVDLLKGNRTTNLYTINLHEMASASLICLMARATSTKSKDKAPEKIKTFLKKIIVLLQALVIIVRSDNGTEFKNQVLKEYFDSVGISQQASSIRTPQ
ncbi:integrase, catalytic region, zinc finger, CCHC-type containing protein [Tanacetum coccineum]